MNALLRLFLVVSVVLISSAVPVLADNGPTLSRELAAKLIAEANQIRANEVAIGPMHVVERKLDSSTVATGGICVTFVAPRIVEGGRRREVQVRTFFHDVEWGWYLYAIETIRGGEAIDVVSETKGRFEVR
ncbi:hypothetical protein V2O64_03660 [Verrucomicrobiaceae bacterium 227]